MRRNRRPVMQYMTQLTEELSVSNMFVHVLAYAKGRDVSRVCVPRK